VPAAVNLRQKGILISELATSKIVVDVASSSPKT
jgi:hypothetical protein